MTQKINKILEVIYILCRKFYEGKKNSKFYLLPEKIMDSTKLFDKTTGKKKKKGFINLFRRNFMSIQMTLITETDYIFIINYKQVHDLSHRLVAEIFVEKVCMN
jgi:uncharacterized FlgJ-related protein